jgi:hypothetical protein
MSDEDSKPLEEHLGDDDWALIIGKDGNLKGLFMPDGTDEDLVPESVVYIMSEYFGVDFDEEMNEEESSDGQTIH